MPEEVAVQYLLGRYAVYDKIAAGGMASVHLGRLRGPVGFARTVAIKRLHAQFAEDPDFVSMFLDEARLVSRISHPNVVPTLDVVAECGELFLVMEYVHGDSLARLSKAAASMGGRIPAEMAVTILVGVLHGLHAAHEARSERGVPLGIVHRDVSPQNILVGVDGTPRVLDFGIAKSFDRIHSTQNNALKGKLAYMAPEQVRGRVSRATDVYAASIVLWESLTGRKLFPADTEAELLEQVLRGTETPPSAFAPGLPPILDEITLRGLSVHPAERYETAREMARVLEDAVSLAPPSRLGDWVEGMMKDQLSVRSLRIGLIESNSAREVPKLPLTSRPFSPKELVSSLVASVKTDVTPRNEGDAREGDGSPTMLSSGSISAPGRSSREAPPFTHRRLVTGLGACGLVGALLLILVRGGGTADVRLQAQAAAPPSETSLPAAAAARPAAPDVPGSAATVADDPVAPAPPPLPAARSDEAATIPKTTTPQAKHARARPAATSRCNPPFTIDSRGVKWFKKECM